MWAPTRLGCGCAEKMRRVVRNEASVATDRKVADHQPSRVRICLRALGGVAVQRCRFPVVDPSGGTGQGSGQSLGRVVGTSHGELDLLVDLAGQAPSLVLWPHEVRFLIPP